jgi:spermidine synthase
VHYRDGWSFAAESTGSYDVVVVDLPDERPEPVQQNRLYGVDFLRTCRNLGRVVVFQAGCPTLWRNASLRWSWHRFHETFEQVVYFGSDEHEWSFLSGLAEASGADPVAAMSARLATLPYRPRTIDIDSLVASTIPPKTLRA